MTVKQSDLTTAKGFPGGIDNVSREDALKPGTLREATNVDLLSGGKVQRRTGRTSIYTGTRLHSLHGFADHLVFHENGSIKYMTTAGSVLGTLVTGLDSSKVLAFQEVNGELYWSNSETTGRIMPDFTVRVMGLETPSGPVTVTPNEAAGVCATSGTYQVSCVFVDQWGRESGATLAAITNTAAESISVTNIPQPVSSDITKIALYLTKRDSDVLQHVKDVTVGTTSATLHVNDPKGKTLATQFCTEMPAGHLLAFVNGRLWVADGNVAFCSEPHNFGLTKLHENFVQFASRITLLAPAGQGEGAGLFVSEGKRTHFLAGAGPGNQQLLTAYPYGAIEGTMAMVPASRYGVEYSGEVPYWLSTNGGPCIGIPGGSVRPLNENFHATDTYQSGASLFREWKGMRHVLSALNHKTAATGFAASDTAVATVTRNGVEV